MIKTIINLVIAIEEDQIKHLFEMRVIIDQTKLKIFEINLK